MIDRVFVCGTLMVPEVMRAVTGKSLRAADATLRNYVRYRLWGRVYPGIRKSASALVHGCIYHGVDRHCLALLDDFEGDEYRRIRVRVMVAGGKKVSAYTYAIRPRFTRLLMKQDWDPARFVRKDLKLYLQKLGTRGGG